jgi:hypothetical protein
MTPMYTEVPHVRCTSFPQIVRRAVALSMSHISLDFSLV